METQSLKYVKWLPLWVDCYKNPLPFSYESTWAETRFTNHLEIEPTSRQIFAFHRPETLLEYAQSKKQSLELMQNLPPLEEKWLRTVQIEAIKNLEKSLVKNKQRALIQMATWTWKTFTFCNIAYRLIKHTKAKRILFLVDRWNLARQALKEFQNFSVPWDWRKFTEIYNVQNMASNKMIMLPKLQFVQFKECFQCWVEMKLMKLLKKNEWWIEWWG